MRTLASWSFRHRRLVVALWLLAVAVTTIGSKIAGAQYRDNLSLPGTSSAQAAALIKGAAPRVGDTDYIVFAVHSGSLIDPATNARIQTVLARVARLPHVTAVASPFAAPSRQIARDGRTGFAAVTFDKPGRLVSKSASGKVISTARSAADHGLSVALGGEAIAESNQPSLGGAGFGILAAALVLFLAFGSVTAMALPLGTALISLGTSLGLIGILSRVLTMATFTTQLASLIGLGVGIDYAMFIVSRYRQGVLAGRDPEEATVIAVNTSGRAVLFAGITVCIALLGMFALGVSVFYGVAIAASLAVLITLLAALTLQPALLGFFGARVLPRREREAAARGVVEKASPRWSAWAAQLQRSPAAFGALGVVVLAVLAVPLLSLRLGFSDAGNDPTTTTTRQAYDLLAKGFGPGFNGPFELVAQVPTADASQAFNEVLAAVAQTPGVAEVSPATALGHSVALAEVYPTTAPQAAATSSLLNRLRHDVIPRAILGTGLKVSTGGPTAVNADFSHRLAVRLPIFIGVVVGLSFLLLTMVFRSVLVPLVAALMNLLSVGAAFGVITAVFEWGWARHLFGISNTGPIEAFIPVIIFAVLFGLSMDYEVFLVSRMHEIWLQTRDNTLAVTGGLIRTGRTITAAAAIMFFVFGSFVLGDDRIVKLFGMGLASAVLIDALVVRTLVLPSIMLLIGKRNWALPRALERITPRLPVESADELVALPPLVASVS